jgi:hypothetical protein
MAGHLKTRKSLEKPEETPGWVSGKVLADVLGMSRSGFQRKVAALALPEEIEKRDGQVFYLAPGILRRYFEREVGCAFPHCVAQRPWPSAVSARLSASGEGIVRQFMAVSSDCVICFRRSVQRNPSPSASAGVPPAGSRLRIYT